MTNAAADDAATWPGEGHTPHNLIVSGLVALIGRVRASPQLIEAAIAREDLVAGHNAASLIVLDNVTPRYLKASVVLKACEAGLGVTLDMLRDSRTPASSLN
ncbi:hypothetical protein [Bradyrhizobium lablabi]|uniref:hypothetical protein n=1 Tax=Bradyrhizobium lablabi TaxID=722472 RepID=UPI001BA51E88|nr:hypothetical protein [Bradyrhizobium lablabi]MBR0695546.1 hypothetical protein [Bradyrhizobium lablabi]